MTVPNHPLESDWSAAMPAVSNRRQFLAAMAAAVAAGPFIRPSGHAAALAAERADEHGAQPRAHAATPVAGLEAPVARGETPGAQVAITLDLEMSRDYPVRGVDEWNFEKGNLDQPTKEYSVEAARRVAAAGGRLHFFCVGRVLEQRDAQWLQDIAAAGHPVGNHTYDHVNLLATTPEQIQFRFQRAPWLIAGRSVEDVLRENVAITTLALKERTGITAAGFRTPGGFQRGLLDRPDVQQWLLDAGFPWVSSLYPAHATSEVGQPPSEAVLSNIARVAVETQPCRYPNGLIEIPMSPISDVGAFRTGRWQREWFVQAVEQAVTAVIQQGGVFDFLAHPSCLVVEDPEFVVIERICQLVRESNGRARLATLDDVAKSVPPRG
jgi:peptidoglycan/xylan/chitin deacetylase (PgdA/CDA1 family)